MVIWILYCIFDGLVDAFMFHKAYKANDFDNKILKIDIHKFLSIRRLIVLGLIIIKNDPIPQMVVIFCCFVLVQPFFHNGVYFSIRNVLDKKVYKNSFFTTKEKDDSSALIDINDFKVRLTLFLVGVIIFGVSKWYF